MNGTRARLFGTGESALAVLCPHCRGPIEVHVLAGGAPLQPKAHIAVPVRPAVVGVAPPSVRHCACGHPDSFHDGQTGACQHGQGTAFGGCGCTHFHARRRGKAAAAGAALVRTGPGFDDASVEDVPSAARRPKRAGQRLLILHAIAWRGADGATVKQIALLTGYSRRGGGSGSFRKAMAEIVRDGQAEKTGDRYRLTANGYTRIGGAPQVPTGAAYLDFWAQRLGACAGSILQRLTVAHPNAVALDEIRKVLGYSDKGGGSGSFRKALSELRELELLTRVDGGYLRASEPLMERIANAH